MYNEKLEALISAALADGVLTEKEKQVLFKKAEAMGIDLDEFEMVLEGRLAKCQKEKAEKEPQPAKPTQKKKAIPQELDDLIQEYLTDGIISAKERQVLLNKAVSLGLNVDEVDLYIDAQQQKADQAVAAAMNKRRGKTCPYCGSSIPELTDKCPNCGGNITPEASKELEEIFNQLEDALVNFKSGDEDSVSRSKAEVERYVRKAKMYYGNNPKVQRMLEEVEAESAAADEEIKKNARKKLIVKNKKTFIGAVVFVILAVVCFIAYNNYKLKNDPVAVCNKVENLVKEKKFSEAEALMVAYSDGKGYHVFYDDLKTGAVALKKGLIENGEYEKAVSSFVIAYAYSHDKVLDISEMKAFLLECIGKMKGNQSTAEIKSFIDQHFCGGYESWDEYGEDKKQLYEAAGIK